MTERQMTKPSIGEIEIFYINYEDNEADSGEWYPFDLDQSLEFIQHNHKFPRARACNGSEWISISVKDYILYFMSFLAEDIDD